MANWPTKIKAKASSFEDVVLGNQKPDDTPFTPVPMGPAEAGFRAAAEARRAALATPHARLNSQAHVTGPQPRLGLVREDERQAP